MTKSLDFGNYTLRSLYGCFSICKASSLLFVSIYNLYVCFYSNLCMIIEINTDLKLSFVEMLDEIGRTS